MSEPAPRMTPSPPRSAPPSSPRINHARRQPFNTLTPSPFRRSRISCSPFRLLPPNATLSPGYATTPCERSWTESPFLTAFCYASLGKSVASRRERPRTGYERRRGTSRLKTVRAAFFYVVDKPKTVKTTAGKRNPGERQFYEPSVLRRQSRHPEKARSRRKR